MMFKLGYEIEQELRKRLEVELEAVKAERDALRKQLEAATKAVEIVNALESEDFIRLECRPHGYVAVDHANTSGEKPTIWEALKDILLVDIENTCNEWEIQKGN